MQSWIVGGVDVNDAPFPDAVPLSVKEEGERQEYLARVPRGKKMGPKLNHRCHPSAPMPKAVRHLTRYTIRFSFLGATPYFEANAPCPLFVL